VGHVVKYLFLLAMSLLSVALAAAMASGMCGTQGLEARKLARIMRDDSTSIIVLDLRGRQAYLAGTVPGAVDPGNSPEEFRLDARGGIVILVTEEGATDKNAEKWVKALCRRNIDARVLKGGVAAWLAAGLKLEKPEDRFVKPGTVPFVIPRGLCEMNEPAQVFE